MTEYGVCIDGGYITFPGHTLVDYIRIAEKNNGQVVMREIGPWVDYTGERSDPVRETATEVETLHQEVLEWEKGRKPHD